MNARDPRLPASNDTAEALGAFANRIWDDEIVPALTDYIEVPAKSPMFDADWAKNGFIDRVVHRHDLRAEISRIIDYAGK